MSTVTPHQVVFTPRCKAYRKFVGRMGVLLDLTLDTSVHEVKFVNVNTQFAWQCFLAGWMAQPNYNEGWVTILGRVDPDGFVTVSERPHLHMATASVVREKERLSKKHGARFVEFKCFDLELVSKVRWRRFDSSLRVQEPKTAEGVSNEDQVQV
jgi:hypothetical protein